MILEVGCDYRMSEYDAIFASAVLKDIDKNNQKRAEIANIYFEQLKDLRHLKLPVGVGRAYL